MFLDFRLGFKLDFEAQNSERGESHAADERQENDGPTSLVDGGHVEAVAQVPGLK